MALLLNRRTVLAWEPLGVLARSAKQVYRVEHIRICLIRELLLNFVTERHDALTLSSAVHVLVIEAQKPKFVPVIASSLVELTGGRLLAA